MTDVTAERIREIRDREQIATEGQWDIFLGSGMHVCTAIGVNQPDYKVTFICDCAPDWMVESNLGVKDHRPNMNFIAHARDDIPWLLDYISYLEEELKTAGMALKGV